MALILVIDDEPRMRDLIRLILEDAGHKVEEAENGRVGLSTLASSAPDLVIVDLFMPEKDGFEMIRDVKVARPALKIIAMSGGGQYGLLGMLESTKDLGAAATVAKPFRAAELQIVVKDVLGR